MIAYLLPGFVALWGLSFRVEQLRFWLGQANDASTTIGGFLYTTLAALTFGLIASTLRWLVIDSLHHWTGIRRPKWNFSKLQNRLGAYSLLEEGHYRYYQFYANMLIASSVGYLGWRTSGVADVSGWEDLLFAGFLCLMYLGSRDTLYKYYGRVHALLKSR